MAPLFVDNGLTEMSNLKNIHDLPKLKHLDKTIICHRPEICNAIIQFSVRVMRIAMSEKMRLTLITEKR